jgi:hypothetical protein
VLLPSAVLALNHAAQPAVKKPNGCYCSLSEVPKLLITGFNNVTLGISKCTSALAWSKAALSEMMR